MSAHEHTIAPARELESRAARPGAQITTLAANCAPTEVHSHVTDPLVRKMMPITAGVLDYFPDAVAYVAYVSYMGNLQHNPGQPLHWNRGKSMDHADCAGRHLVARGTLDNDRVRHAGKLAWRALAILQHELEAAYDLPAPKGTQGPPKTADR